MLPQHVRHYSVPNQAQFSDPNSRPSFDEYRPRDAPNSSYYNPASQVQSQQAFLQNNVQPSAQFSPLSHSQEGFPTPNNLSNDMQIDDADPYNRAKFASRSSHGHSAGQGHSRQFSTSRPGGYEESAASRRYSPVKEHSVPVTPAMSHGFQQPMSRQAPEHAMNANASASTPHLNTQLSPSFGGQEFKQPQTPNQSRYPRQQQLPLHLSVNSYDATNEPAIPQSATQHFNAVFGREPRPAPPSFTLRRPGQIPRFQRISSVQELQPLTNPQPAFRRLHPEGGFISPLQALTLYLASTYRICNPEFSYERNRNPRRVLTKPSKPVKNDGYDNEDSDYILYVNDILGNDKNRYLILDVLGQGTFGQVVKCQNLRTQEVVAVKVVKNRTAYFNQSMMEVSILELINSKLDKHDDHGLLRLKDTFIHRQHLCLVFELLSVNLYELIKQNQFRGLSTTLVRVFAQQLLHGLSLLSKARLIHCDLKPENILLKNLESPIIKIIDFGSACDERQTVYTYIQSRFYRSPEVLLGLSYTSSIDMWSLGCILVELFLGLPLFPGSSEYNQVSRIVEMLGMPPTWMLEVGRQSGDFFHKVTDEFGRRQYALKSMEQYSREHGGKEQPSKKYFTSNNLEDIIINYGMPRKNMKPEEIDREMANRIAFVDFIKGLVNLHPIQRWTPAQAKNHPFVLGTRFTGPYVPPMHLDNHSTARQPGPGLTQQINAEAQSKQRQQSAAMAMTQPQSPQTQLQPTMPSPYLLQQQGPYPSTIQPQQPPVYGAMYPITTDHTLPMYTQHQTAYAQGIPGAYAQPQQNPNLLSAQQSRHTSRQRASTMEQQQAGIPAAIQRVASHLDPNAPIRSQPSPAYYPPPNELGPDGMPTSARRGGRSGRGQRSFIQALEERTMEEGFMGQQQWR